MIPVRQPTIDFWKRSGRHLVASGGTRYQPQGKVWRQGAPKLEYVLLRVHGNAPSLKCFLNSYQESTEVTSTLHHCENLFTPLTLCHFFANAPVSTKDPCNPPKGAQLCGVVEGRPHYGWCGQAFVVRFLCTLCPYIGLPSFF